jgi:bifunctional non-homologous end joining protein LigD
MPLDEYRAKRDFRTTPEPRGSSRGAGRTESRFFCVQKHLAGPQHYDVRLELDGVLLSWAVPKGPSLNPAERRLAMHVEDHPVEYGTFEGVIPEGYGAGIVMLWDRGTWRPEVSDVHAALEKGDLKFTLDGYKLKGSWVLVRTRGGDGRSWLLIKHRDQWAGDLDITAFAPRSVKSNGDFEDILAADTPSIWVSNRPARSGAAGAMLEGIIERAAALKAAREGMGPRARPKRAGSSRSKRVTTGDRAPQPRAAAEMRKRAKPRATRKSG